MSRFKWLEFDEPREPGAGAPDAGDGADAVPGIDMTDARQVLKLAEDAYRALDYEKALRFYSKSLSIDPNIEEAWAGQLRCLLDLNENPETLTWATKAQKLFPKNPDIQSARALALARLGRLQEAIGFSDGAMRSDRHGWFTWVARGEILAIAGSGNAEFCMMKAMESGRESDWLITLKIAQAYVMTPVAEKALVMYKKVLSERGDLAEVWYELAKLQFDLGCVGEARESIEHAVRLMPNNRKYAELQNKTLSIGSVEHLMMWLRNVSKGWFRK